MRIDEGYVKHTRTFDGKPFGMAIAFDDSAYDISKTFANRISKAYRSRGWLTRVVPSAHGYAVYRSQNKAAFYK